jgi:PAS domain S-box-containing protein
MGVVQNKMLESPFYKSIVKGIEKIFHFFIPRDPLKDKTQLSKEKYHVLFFLSSVITLVLVTVILTLVKGKSFSHPLNTFIHYFTIVVSLFTILYLKWKKNIKQVLMIFTLNVFSVSVVTILLTGGVYSIETIWQLMLIMSATLLISRKFGFVMLLLSVFCIYIMYAITEVWELEELVQNIDSGSSFRLATLYLFFTIFYFICSGIVYNREKMQKTLSEVKQEQIDIIDTKYKFIVENSSLIVGIHTLNGIRTYTSEAITTILGYTVSKLIGQDDQGIIKKEERENYNDLLSNCISKKRLQSKTIIYIHNDGGERFMQVRLKPIINSDGSFEAIISSLSDVTEDKLLEQKLKETRHQIAQDFHDEIGNKLALISSKANLLTKKANKNEDLSLKNTAGAIEKNTLELFRDFKDFIWSVEGKETNLSELYYYLKDLLESTFNPISIKILCLCKLSMTNENRIIDAFKKKNIISIIKEASSNILKHSGANEVIFSIYEENQFIVFCIKDNGKGIGDCDLSSKGMGLKNMKERAAKINAEITMESEKGCEIKLYITV